MQAVKNNRLGKVPQGSIAGSISSVSTMHFLSSRKRRKTELLHTFDAIDLGGSQIVLASDDHPARSRRS